MDATNPTIHTDRFIDNVINNEALYMLERSDGVACCFSDDNRNDAAILFWSERKSAQQAQKSMLNGYDVVAISLFEFIYEWLPHLFNQGEHVVIDWQDQSVDPTRHDPSELQAKLTTKMTKEMLSTYRQRKDSKQDNSKILDVSHI